MPFLGSQDHSRQDRSTAGLQKQQETVIQCHLIKHILLTQGQIGQHHQKLGIPVVVRRGG